ncbi:hypothetical protein RMATCC62417_09650 [Rhizopus microsporus]|nr:hypothetical protein RMATCC62417_09650 [Rhizopus microsporus]
MDYVVDQNEFIVEPIATHTEYLKNTTSSESPPTCPILIEKSKGEDIRMNEANSKRDYVRYTIQDKAGFFDLKFEKCRVHQLQRSNWASTFELLRDGLNSMICVLIEFLRACVLTEEHKMTVVNFIDTNPSAAVVEVAERLLKRFNDLKVSRSTVYNFMRSECNLSLKKADFHSIERNSPTKIEERHDWVCKWENTDMNFLTNCMFLDESAFDINMKCSRAWSKNGARAIVTGSTTRVNITSILGAISAAGLITAGVKKPRPAKKRKAYGYTSSGTVTGHYLSFLKITLDEMDKHPHMEGHYVVIMRPFIRTKTLKGILSVVDINMCIFLLACLSLTQ